MESETSSTKIDKLNYSNYHFWKIRIVHNLTLKDLENFLDDEVPLPEPSHPEEMQNGRRVTKRLKLSLV